MRHLVALPGLLALAGCWFFYIPSTGPSAEVVGNTCVGTDAYVGQTINNQGRYGTLEKIYGASERCRSNPSRPILVDVVYRDGVPGAALAGNTCVGTNAYVGQTINNQGRYGTLDKVYGASERCRSDPSRPILVDVPYRDDAAKR